MPSQVVYQATLGVWYKFKVRGTSAPRAPNVGSLNGPRPHQDNPAKNTPTKQMETMADNYNTSPPSDPPIFKHLNAKTQGLLRQSHQVQQEQKQAANMSNEQT